MRINELLVETQEVEGIEKLSPRYFQGGKKSLNRPYRIFNVDPGKSLPGNNGLLYTLDRGEYVNKTEIRIWDPAGQSHSSDQPGQLIGKLSVLAERYFPIPNAVSVSAITVDEKYRGRGIAKALYNIVLTVLKRPLLAGDSQTPSGRKMWVSLASMPGVEVKGYIELNIFDLEKSSQADKNIDTIMRKLGGQYIGQSPTSKYFAFDVIPSPAGKQLVAHVKTHLSKIYGYTEYNSGLYAIWNGA